MVITYLIGNGFDLASGLATQAKTIIGSYRDTVKSELIKNKATGTSSEGLEAMNKSLCMDYELWSDFEHAIGSELANRCAKMPHPILAYKQAYNHFVNYLFNYIMKENDFVSNVKLTADQLKRFQNGVTTFMVDGLRPKQSDKLNSLLERHNSENWDIGFISFNYTTLLDRIITEASRSAYVPHSATRNSRKFLRTLHEPLHIHGSVTDSHGILVGVDNSEQIIEKKLADDEGVREPVVKPLQNDAREDLAQENALNLISKSTLICIFGMSLGESDQTWWKALGEWLSEATEGRRLIINTIFNGRDVTPAAYGERIRERRNDFFERAGIQDEETRKLLSDSLLIAENSEAFNLGITINRP